MDCSIDDLGFRHIHRIRATGPALADVAEAVKNAIGLISPTLKAIPTGAKVAITCGSRGIDHLPQVIQSVCSAIKEKGCSPLVVPAMGSHAGATGPSQKKLLTELGVTEQVIGAPILSSMDTVNLGQTPEGIDVYMDRIAWESEHVLLLNRVKMHTDFDGAVESGLLKMLAVGLGKIDGATSFHRNSLRVGYENAILAMSRHLLNTGRIVGGIGLVENDRHCLSKISASTADKLEEMECDLLAYSRKLHGRLPFSNLDLLIVDEIGKNISGAGMDTKVIGRAVHPDREFTKPEIKIRRIYVRDLTNETFGNANGMGLADVIHERVTRKVDFHVTYTNARTALAFRVARMPMSFPNDRSALTFLLNNLGSPPIHSVRAAWIKNTLALEDFLVTGAALPELQNRTDYQVAEEAIPLTFDLEGELMQVARRGV